MSLGWLLLFVRMNLFLGGLKICMKVVLMFFGKSGLFRLICVKLFLGRLKGSLKE